MKRIDLIPFEAAAFSLDFSNPCYSKACGGARKRDSRGTEKQMRRDSEYLARGSRIASPLVRRFPQCESLRARVGTRSDGRLCFRQREQFRMS